VFPPSVIFYGLVGSNVCKILPNIDKTSKNKEVYEGNGGEGVLPRPAKILFRQDYSLRTALPAHTSAHPGTVDVSGRVRIGPVHEAADVCTGEGTLTNSVCLAECLLSGVERTLLHAAE
jgi:hypothetical protein